MTYSLRKSLCTVLKELVFFVCVYGFLGCFWCFVLFIVSLCSPGWPQPPRYFPSSASRVLGLHIPVTTSSFQLFGFLFCFLIHGLMKFSRLALNSQSFLLQPPSCWDYRPCHQACRDESLEGSGEVGAGIKVT